jgi:flagellar P-ring protein precursor FlgI
VLPLPIDAIGEEGRSGRKPDAFLGTDAAHSSDPTTVQLRVPGHYKSQVVNLLTDIEQLRVEPDQLARRIVLAMKRNEVFVYEPWLVKVTPLLKSLLPVKLSDLLSDLFRASSSMRSWRGHG